MPNELTPEQADIQRRFAEATREPSLFEIVERGMLVLAQLDETEGEVTPSIAADLEALAESLEQKTEVYAAMHRLLLENADACDRFADHYGQRAKQQRARADALKARLLDAMRLLGRDKIKTPTASASIQKSPPRVELTCLEQDVPAEFVETRRVIRHDLIKAALQDSTRQLTFARLTRGVHLRFR